MTFYLNYKDTSYWGPIYWNILHHLAKKVDENTNEIKNKFLNILKNFTSLIPCDDCSSTYLKTLNYAFELLLLNNVVTKYYFQKLIYYLHLCVAVKKYEEKNLEIFMSLLRKKKSLEMAYKKIIFPILSILLSLLAITEAILMAIRFNAISRLDGLFIIFFPICSLVYSIVALDIFKKYISSVGQKTFIGSFIGMNLILVPFSYSLIFP